MNSDRAAKNPNIRVYNADECVSFRKTNEVYGGLSNMASGYPIYINDCLIFSSEALYQALRFPHLPEVQKEIIAQKSPMTAKMISKPHRANSREDWKKSRINIMRWVLAVKLAQNYQTFSELLLSTGERDIVESSRKDAYWGAILNSTGQYEGTNALGRLLMELRVKIKSEPSSSLKSVNALTLPNFHLLGREIGTVNAEQKKRFYDGFSLI